VRGVRSRVSELLGLDSGRRNAEAVDGLHEAVHHRVDAARLHLGVRRVEARLDARLRTLLEPRFQSGSNTLGNAKRTDWSSERLTVLTTARTFADGSRKAVMPSCHLAATDYIRAVVYKPAAT
jgi:hypothetical protein